LANAGAGLSEDWIAMEASLWRSEDVRKRAMDLCHLHRSEALVQATKDTLLAVS